MIPPPMPFTPDLDPWICLRLLAVMGALAWAIALASC
jgi:hypothetical protein